MNKILVIELPEAMYETFAKGLPPGSKILFDSPVDSTSNHPYARWFNSESPSWSEPKFEEYNWLFLRVQQNWANDLLRARGHLFLNEVYGMLGLSHTSAGAVVGWVHDPRKVDGIAVDFGCWDQQPLDPDREGAIRLNFNVDGPILQMIG